MARFQLKEATSVSLRVCRGSGCSRSSAPSRRLAGEGVGRCDQLRVRRRSFLTLSQSCLIRRRPWLSRYSTSARSMTTRGQSSTARSSSCCTSCRVREIDLTAESHEQRSVRLLEPDRKELIAHVGGRSTTGSRKRTVVPVGVESRLKSIVRSRMSAVPRPRSGLGSGDGAEAAEISHRDREHAIRDLVDLDVHLAGGSALGRRARSRSSTPPRRREGVHSGLPAPMSRSSSQSRIEARSLRSSPGSAGKTRWKPALASGLKWTASTATSSSRDVSTPRATTR